LVPFKGRRSTSRVDTVRNAASLGRRVATDQPDLVHSFGRLVAMLPVMPWPVPKLMSYQREVTARSIQRSHALAGESLEFAACSHRMIESVASVGRWHVVYNAVDVNRFAFVKTVDREAPLVFLGRVEHIKGAHVAIDVAKRAGRRLVIAGNVPEDATHQTYFREQVMPHVDGRDITYVGPVDDQQKSELLGRAAALLMPVLWEEPFGIVMAEALACGTPVIGLARGAVPEVVADGVTGFVCSDADEMVRRVGEVGRLDRAACRQAAERRFSQRALVDAYEEIYRGMVDGPSDTRTVGPLDHAAVHPSGARLL